MSGVFVDTSAWFAAANRESRHYAEVIAAFNTHRGCLVTSNFVVNETLTLIRSRLGWHAARRFGEKMRAGRTAQQIRVTPADEDAAWAIFVRYKDHVFSFTDCTSFALMRRLGLATAVVLDNDFRTYGLRCLP